MSYTFPKDLSTADPDALLTCIGGCFAAIEHDPENAAEFAARGRDLVANLRDRLHQDLRPAPRPGNRPAQTTKAERRGRILPRFVSSRLCVTLLLLPTAYCPLPPASAAGDLRSLYNAIRQVETGGHPDPASAIGDGGASRGPYQIGVAYWRDSRTPGRYADVRDARYAERVMHNYWQRYCPRALQRRDWETLARAHNGGPAGPQRRSTLGYWTRVRRHIP